MTASRLLLAAVFSYCMIAPLAGPLARAQDQALPQVANSPHRFAAAIKGDSVNIRSGPGENYYATMRVERGTPITVVGIKFDWLKIVPPENSFSLVGKAFVQREGDSDVGIVTSDVLNVRAGSSLTPIKVAIQCKLKRGDQVSILGEQDEYYEIKPPADAYLYVHKDFAEPVRQLSPTTMAPAGDSAGELANTPARGPRVYGDDELAPSEILEPVADAPEPEATRLEQAEAEFERLEAEWTAAAEKPLDQQPTAEMLAAYEALAGNRELPIRMQRVIHVRVASLRIRDRAREELLATTKQQQVAMAKIEALRAERQRLEQRLEQGIVVFAAVGTLQTTSLQSGGESLYRLIDPATSRTICYVRTAEPQHGRFLGQFVGVNGEVGTEPRLSLKVVRASEIAGVEPGRVGRGVSAQISPPSLQSRPAEQASADNN